VKFRIPGFNPEEADAVGTWLADSIDELGLAELASERAQAATILERIQDDPSCPSSLKENVFKLNDKAAAQEFRINKVRTILMMTMSVVIEKGEEVEQRAFLNVTLTSDNPGHVMRGYERATQVLKDTEKRVSYEDTIVSRLTTIATRLKETGLVKKAKWKSLVTLIDKL